MTTQRASLTCLFACLLGGACSPSELLVDVSNLTSSIDELDVYVATQATSSSAWMVSQRIVVNNAQGLDTDADGHYKLTLDHSLPLTDPGQAQVFVGAMSHGCLRGVGSASGELQVNNKGYTTFSIPLAASMPPNESTPCEATQPKITTVELSRRALSDGSVTTSGLVSGWGFSATSEVHIVVMPSTSSMNSFQSVDDIIANSEYFPDHLRFSLASIPANKVAAILAPSLPTVTLTKSIQIITPGTPDVTSNLFPF